MLYRNYQLNKTHSALKFGKSEGYPLVLSNAKSAPVRKLEVSGNSYQATRGKNLFNVDAITSTYGGYVENGTIYVTGYPYETGITPEKFLEMTELKEGDTFTTDLTYTQFGDTTNNTWGNMRFASKVSGVSNLNLVSKGTGITSTIPKNFNSSNYTSIYIYSGNAPEEGDIRSTCENMAVYKGAYTTDTMPPYEPYVKMPSPDHPSEIVSVGDKTANLFDYEYFFDNSVIEILTRQVYEMKPNTNYTVFTNVPLGGEWASVFLSSGEVKTVTTINDGVSEEKPRTVMSDENGEITITLRTATVSAAIAVNKDDFTNGKYWIMLLEGTYTADTMPEYEPYGYRVPIECRGRNLFDVNIYTKDKNYIASVSGSTINFHTNYSSAVGWYWTNIKVKQGKTYTIFVSDMVGVSGRYRFSENEITEFSGEVYSYAIDILKEKNIATFSADTDGYLVIAFNLPADSTDGYINELQILEGAYTSETMPPYEPYYHDTVNIYTDKPLYGIDDYTDSITLDFEKKKAVRTDRIKEFTLTNLQGAKTSSSGDKYTAYYITNYSFNFMGLVKGSRIICDMLPFSATTHYAMGNYIGFGGNVNLLYISLSNSLATTIDEASQVLDGAKCYMPMTEPTETDISDTIDWDSLSLHLQKGTNILSTNTAISPSNLAVKYIRR